MAFNLVIVSTSAPEMKLTISQPCGSAIQRMPKDVVIYFSEHSYWEPSNCGSRSGRMTLAGDAAHAMPPNRGQDCDHAINDAISFAQAVEATADGAERSFAMQSYSDGVVVRGFKETLLSRETAFKTGDYDNFKDHGTTRHGLARSPEQ